MKPPRAAISPAVTAVTLIIAVIVAGGGAYYVGHSTAPSSTVTSTETLATTVSGPTETATRSTTVPTTVAGPTETATATQTVVGGTQTVSTTVTGPTETATTTESAIYTFTTTRTVTNPALLPAPVQTSPANGSSFSNYPRTTELQWDPVSGAAYYLVQVDFYSPGDTTCTGGSIDAMNVTTSTTFTFDFVGEQPGCWTVSAVAADGQAGLASPWWEFTYTV